MQDIHLIGGGGGRFFIGSGGGDHRLRTHQHHPAAAAKCPRCDSVNTKFCYYNNYNLSQPRHFCKSCRRYWTKGGVLRNVPVGGGCRKSKRPASKRNSASVDQEEEDEAAKSKSSEKPPAAATNNSRSSDSSSLSASAVEIASMHSPAAVSDFMNGVLDSVSLSASAAKPVTEHPKLYGTSVSASTSFSTSINGTSNSNSYGNGDAVEWTAVIDGLGSASNGGFLPEIGSLTTLIPAPSAETTAFGYEGRIVNHLQENQGGAFYDHFSGRASFTGTGGFEALDWTSANDDQGLFDLPRTVDQTYWSQNQWSRDDGQHGLFP